MFPKHCPQLYDAPKVLGVGDLHIENFGTWRDGEGRLSWGVNDFDEACFLPYTNDLIRLATSAYFALTDASNPLSLDFKDACWAIQEGYVKGLEKPRPFILAEDHDWLRNIVISKLVDPESSDKGDGKDDLFKKFYHKYTTLADVEGAVPADARAALDECFPRPIPDYEIRHREAGLGSLGRQRFTAIARDWQGGLIVREAKALVPSARLWANREREESAAAALAARTIYYPEIIGKAVRAADPWLMTVGRWAVRRLGPDAFKVEIQDLELKRSEKEELTKQLFKAMGKETANIHSSDSTSLDSRINHLRGLSKDFQSAEWLFGGAMAMVDQTCEDFRDWKKEGYQCPSEE